MIPKELQVRYDKCVKKVQANGGKNKSESESICELSLTSMIPAPKEKQEPYEVIASAEKDVHYVFSSDSKINAENEGVIIKNVEIFKAGTFKGTEFKLSALEKMVANFYVLKSHGIFDHVPVRCDHPGWLGEVGVLDRVGGYVKDLRVVGKKLVADIRLTSQSMLDKIKEGSYVQRSAEIGNYRDNNGDTWGPCLWGFAWVDIPAVEGLSPTFSFTKNENIELIKLNSEDMHVKKHGVETPVEEVVIATTTVENPVEEVNEEVVEETPIETPVIEIVPPLGEISSNDSDEKVKDEEEQEVEEEIIENTVEEAVVETPTETGPSLDVNITLSIDDLKMQKFAKEYPVQYAELQKLKKEKIDGKIQLFLSQGKLLPAQKEKMQEFVSELNDSQFLKLSAIFEEMPALLKLNGAETVEITPQETPENGEVNENEAAEKNATEFIEKTN